MVIMRRRPLLRAAVVGGGAYAMGRRSAQRAAEQDELAAKQDQGRQAPAPAAATPTPSVLDQLNQLNQLHKQGALTDEEFRAAKAKLLGT
jgi:putative oligomerization/nucleic acid binding protein